MQIGRSREKRIDLVGSLGAGILGAGMALLFAGALERFAMPAVLVGIAVHGGAMLARMQAERASSERKPPWAIATEWICWLLMLGLLAYVGWSLIISRP
jgi:ABC-type spermidine/putrescine transport system permease subunit I